MKKTLLLSFFSLCLFSVAAQELQGWHIGVALQPYNYWLYNKQDIKEDVNLLFINPKLGKPNGFAAGIVVNKFYTDNFGIKAELTYSTQKQKYDFDYFKQFSNQGVKYSNYTSLDYLKLPIMATYILLPEHNNNIFFSLGLQVSYLAGFVKTTSITDPRFNRFYEDHFTKKSFYSYISKTVNNKTTIDTTINKYSSNDNRYRAIQIGTIAEIGYLHSFNDYWNIQFAVRGEYDFSNVKNLSNVDWRNDLLGTGSGYNTKPSHNLRLGVNLSLTYKLD